MAEWLLPALAIVWVFEVIAYASGLSIHVPPQSLHVPLFHSPVVQWFGATIQACALTLFGFALRGMDLSWRAGIDTQSPGALIADGVFRYTRNPIFVAIDLYVVGAFMINGSLFFVLFAVIAPGMIHCQIVHEEGFLRRHYGDAFTSYTIHIGRYWTVRA